MKMQKINTSFSIYADANLEQKAQYILGQMTGNGAFDSPVPPLPVVSDAVETYSLALVAAAGLDRTKVAFKNEARQSLETLLGKLGMYVMNVALGNVAVLTSSGFTLRKANEPVYIGNPGNVTIANGVTSGELIVSVASVAGAKSYLHQVSTVPPADNTQWVSASSSRSKYTYSELEPGKQYWFRVIAIGARQQQTSSPVATQFAQ